MDLEIFSGIVAALVVCALGLFTIRLTICPWARRRNRATGGAMDAAAQFSAARYNAAGRLLSDEDERFLAEQPGYTKAIGRKFRSDRRRIFRLYVRQLACDFQDLHAAARRMVAESPQEYSGLVGTLMRQQFVFWWAMANIEMRMILPLFGHADLTRAIGALQTISFDLNRLAAPTATMSA
jgi:hypothetical protein